MCVRQRIVREAKTTKTEQTADQKKYFRSQKTSNSLVLCTFQIHKKKIKDKETNKTNKNPTKQS